MPELSHDLIRLLHYLVPGFIAAGIFYGTTAHPKPQQFERIIQALILTVVVHVIVVIQRAVAWIIGEFISFGEWTDESTLMARIVTAIAVGACISIATNHDTMLHRLRKLGATRSSSYPSEWFGVFSQQRRFVTLVLKDGTRLSGWPSVWPESAEKGHFYVTDSTWEGERHGARTHNLKDILINVADVMQVEFNEGPHR